MVALPNSLHSIKLFGGNKLVCLSVMHDTSLTFVTKAKVTQSTQLPIV
jgi:hypothetical protein